MFGSSLYLKAGDVVGNIEAREEFARRRPRPWRDHSIARPGRNKRKALAVRSTGSHRARSRS